MRIEWHGIETGSHEVLDLDVSTVGVRAVSTVEAQAGTLRYTAHLTSAWVFSNLSVEDGHGEKFRLTRSDSGEWFVDASPRPDLSEAVDIDLSFSPFTNSLPIRRLRLNVGEARDIVTAYVTPALDLVPDPQRYTRLADDRYLYESRDSDFRREISVDDNGVIVDYPGLFRRA